MKEKVRDNKESSVTFRTTEELKAKLIRLAAEDSRSLSNMIERLIEKGIESYNKKSK